MKVLPINTQKKTAIRGRNNKDTAPSYSIKELKNLHDKLNKEQALALEIIERKKNNVPS